MVWCTQAGVNGGVGAGVFGILATKNTNSDTTITPQSRETVDPNLACRATYDRGVVGHGYLS